MIILIDTNILIYWEDNKIIDESIQLFFNLSNHFDIIIDKWSFLDIERDKNEERKKIIKSKLWKYKKSDFNLNPDEEFYKIISQPKKDNDIIDDKLLFTLKSWVCDYLITEDKWIHTKSLKLWIKDWVFTVWQFNKYISSLYPEEWILESITNVIHEKWYNIDPEAKDEIFNTLKEDYPQFIIWYKKNNQRKGFFLKNNEGIMWMCLYDDDNEDYLDWIKISTFKVSDIKKWTKSGELLLRQIFLYALNNNKKYLYIEVKINKYILEWLKQFWFYHFWFKNIEETEVILRKDIFSPNINKWIYQNFPFFYYWKETNIFIIPILSEFSNKLFPDVHSQMSLWLDENVCWNTIKKSYLSKSKITLLKEWDLILFYETSTWKWLKEKNQKVISFWIVENTLFTEDDIKAIKFIWKRSVYSYNEILDKLKWWLNIINFLYLNEINEEITYKELLKEWILNWPPQSIQWIDKKHFNYIKWKLWFYYQ